MVDLDTLKVTSSKMPLSICAHSAAAIDERFIILSGGWDDSNEGCPLHFTRFDTE
jgi:hypothetical protein